MPDDSQAALRREIDELGRQVGGVIERFAGPAAFQLVEQVRGLARRLREGDESAGNELCNLLATLDEHQLHVVIRSFSIILELANLAEDRQRVRVLQQRERDAYPEPRRESIGDAIAAFKTRNLSASDVQANVDRVRIELVLTAHPTEAKRRSVRRVLQRVQQLLNERDALLENDRSAAAIHRAIASQIELLWQTDFSRPTKPTVMQEVERGLAFLPILWNEAPTVADDLRQALAANYPSLRAVDRPLVRYASWIGGDRDGNPFVTPETTETTLGLWRQTTVALHEDACRMLARRLSIAEAPDAATAELNASLDRALALAPAIADAGASIPQPEIYRRWLQVVRWRLGRTVEQAAAGVTDADEWAGAYSHASELLADVRLVADALAASGNQTTLEVEVRPWLDQIRMFGLDGARLDIRQHSDVYRAVIDEALSKLGVHADPASLDERERCRLLEQTLGRPLPADAEWSPAATETLDLFAFLRRVARRHGMDRLGEHMVSMTKAASDILTVLWLWRWSENVDSPHPSDRDLRLPVAPLFETITDLDDAAATLRAMFELKSYREHLRGLGDRQTVMIGYSDSTKDGGYLAAQWALQRSQVELQRTASEYGMTITFFHGRGGSLGRGGGPAARGILSLPTEAFSGSLRLTEQGEVLAERYDNPQIAHRHLEQMIWSTLTAVSRRPKPVPEEWTTAITAMADHAFKAYRRLVDHEQFAEFYQAVTPLQVIEKLNIGSRPSKRKAGGRIEDLRAIPWVFSWTQNRALLPAWFGIGAAYDAAVGDDRDAAELVAGMYRKWPFFTAAIDNAILALSKASMPVFRRYTRLAKHIPASDELAQTIVAEYDRSRRAVLAIAGSGELLDGVPWLQRSIQVRNGYVDPLNFVQIELLERARRAVPADPPQQDAEPDALSQLAKLAVQGISAGMRTTG